MAAKAAPNRLGCALAAALLGMLAVFLASPSDFRYQEMQRDRDFLRGRVWKVKWIEFSGGHTLAPAEVYGQAADWLGENLP